MAATLCVKGTVLKLKIYFDTSKNCLSSAFKSRILCKVVILTYITCDKLKITMDPEYQIEYTF